jgi:hypothetical protein
MPTMKVNPNAKKTPKKKQAARKFVLSATEKTLLLKVGSRIKADLETTKTPVEKFSTDQKLARSTLRQIIAGKSNVRLATLDQVARGLGYSKGVTALLTKAGA